MANLDDKIGFIRGLIEGKEIGPDDPKAKLYTALADALEGILGELEDVRDGLSELNDFVESIDEDLEDLEAAMEGDEHGSNLAEDDEDYDEIEDIEDRMPKTDSSLHVLRSDANGNGQALAGSICPECGKLFFVPLEELREENELYACPHCHKPVDFTPLTPENAPIARPYRE